MARLLRPIVALVVAGLVFSLAGRVPELLARVEAFRVDRVAVEGTRYLTEAEVEAALALSADASVWDDPAALETRVRENPLVRSAKVGRRFPSTLVVRVEEREPVALVANPTLEPVDAEGLVVPVDPAMHRLDLPLLRVPAAGRPDPDAGRSRTESPPSASLPERGAGRNPSVGSGFRPVRVLAAEVARLEAEEPSFVALLSEVVWSPKGEVAAQWGDPVVTLYYRPPLTVARAREAMAALSDASARRPDRRVASVDLRYADQVVVRYAGGGRS
jgi:cell division septal protein FtsQ